MGKIRARLFRAEMLQVGPPHLPLKSPGGSRYWQVMESVHQ